MKKPLWPKEVGHFNFNKGIVSATDPCYNDDVWCRLDNIQIKPGEYRCLAYTVAEGEDEGLVGICQIVYGNMPAPKDGAERELLGTIGVDAGLAGFYQDKPNYTDDEWQDFCRKLHPADGGWADFLINRDGFCTSSGGGDGEYPVFAYRNKEGEIYCLEICFL